MVTVVGAEIREIAIGVREGEANLDEIQCNNVGFKDFVVIG